MTFYNCPVCGYDRLTQPPRDYRICPCCGTEFESDEFERTYQDLRSEWIDKDMPWFDRSTLQPKNWNAYRQLLIADYGKNVVTHRRFKTDVNYRYAVNKAFSEVRIGKQLKDSREQRTEPLTQLGVAERAGMKQSRISELEGMNYSSWSISTLERLAQALGVGFRYSFARWDEIAADIAKGLSPNALGIRPFEEEPAFSTPASVAAGKLRNTSSITPNVIAQIIAATRVVHQVYVREQRARKPQPAIDYQVAPTRRNDPLSLAARLTSDAEIAA